jgi:hypothetical protein
VTFSVISSRDGNVVDRFAIEAVGAGTSNADAMSSALDRVVEQLPKHGY